MTASNPTVKSTYKLTRRQKRTAIRITLSFALLVLSALISHFLSDLPDIVKLLIYMLPYLLIGYDVLWRSVQNIFHGKIFDENLLMSIATIGAIVLGDYSEAVAVMLFYQVGEFFQSIAVAKSRNSVAALMDIKPDTARLFSDGKEVITTPEKVNVGDIILVRAGEKIPLDGVVTSGAARLDMSALNGESLPRLAEVGTEVLSGSINLDGTLIIRVSAPFGESTVSKILRLVEEATSKKAKSEKFITRFAEIYTPIVVIFALFLALVPPLVFGGGFVKWVTRALIFLVVSCPCALVISVPLSFFGAIGGSAKHGILFKGSSAIEKLAELRTVGFDKTGTLTEGRLYISNVIAKDTSKEHLLELVTAAEHGSTHPIANAIREAGASYNQSALEEIKVISGYGVSVKYNGNSVLCGSKRLLSENSVEISDDLSSTAVYVSENGKYIGCIELSDKVKPTSKKAIEMLNRLGITKIIMISGDTEKTAREVASSLGITEVKAECLPEDKVEIAKRYSSNTEKNTFAFVGDGINDAPVIASADVGVAMGGIGSDAAIEAADLVIMGDDPVKLPTAVAFSKQTMKIVKQNIFFAIAVKILVLILSSFGLTTMWWAVFADVGVAFLAILNAMRMLGYKYE